MSLRFVTVQVFKRFKFLYERFVLVLQNSHTVLQTLNIFLLLPTALARSLSAKKHYLFIRMQMICYLSGNQRSINRPRFNVPVLHEADFPLACGLLSTSLAWQGGGGRHDHTWSNSACGGGTDLIGLNISRGSWKGDEKTNKQPITTGTIMEVKCIDSYCLYEPKKA